MAQINVFTNQTTTGLSPVFGPYPKGYRAIQFIFTGGGAAQLDVSIDGVNFAPRPTVSTTATDAFEGYSPWVYFRGNCTSLTSGNLTLLVDI